MSAGDPTGNSGISTGSLLSSTGWSLVGVLGEGGVEEVYG